jgi:hypothetical protein
MNIKILICIALLFSMKVSSQESEKKTDENNAGDSKNFLLDDQRRSGISLFQKTDKIVKFSISSPDADIGFAVSSIINSHKGYFIDGRATLYSTKGLFSLIQDQEYIPAWEIKVKSGYRSYSVDSITGKATQKLWILPVHVWWAFIKLSYKKENFNFIQPVNFNSVNLAQDKIFSDTSSDAWDVSANFNFLAGSFTFGTSFGTTRNNNYSSMPEVDHVTYKNNVTDSNGNSISSLTTSKKVRFGDFANSNYGLYSFTDLFIQPGNSWPNFYLYYRTLNIFSDENFKYLGAALLVSLTKSDSRHLANFGIRFESNAVNDWKSLEFKKTNITILGNLSF